MSSDILGSTSRSAGAPALRILASFPVACFTCALATDIAYSRTANMMWADFSAWLLAAGLGLGVLAAIAGLIDLVAHRHTPRPRSPWPVVFGSVVVLLLAMFDNLVHSRDAWTSVMPLGLVLSALLVIVTLVTVWFAAAGPARPEFATQFSGIRR